MSAPVISVVVPLFNSERYIEKALRSLREQAFRDWECVVVNDGSSDNGPALASEFAERDPRFRVIHQVNRGLPAARNTGIEASRGRWLRFLDADDWITPDGLEALLRAGEADGSGLVCGGAAYHDERGEPLHWSFRPGCPRVTHDMLLEGHRFQVCAAMLRRDVLGDARFRGDTEGSEDWDLWLRLGEGGQSWACVDTDVSAYRLRAAGMSRDHARMGRVASRVLRESLDRLGALGREDPARRRRCLRRVAGERASAAALTDPIEAVELWRSLRDGVSGAMTPVEAASVALWSVPYADCLPPTAWSRPPAAERYLDALTRFWSALESSGEGVPGLALDASDELARLLVDPAVIAAEVVRRVRSLGPSAVVLHGLGRNARELAPGLASLGAPLLGRDDAAAGGTIDIGGIPVRVYEPGPWPDGAVHVLTVMHAARLEHQIPNGSRTIKWSEIQADVINGWPPPDRESARDRDCRPATEAAA